MFVNRKNKFVLNIKIIILIIGIALFYQSEVNCQTDEYDIVSAIEIEKIEHPYLFFDEHEKSTLIQRINTDQESKDIFEAIKAKGHRYLYVPIKDQPPTNPKHPRYEKIEEGTYYMREINSGALTLAFLYQMTGDERYSQKAIKFALAICEASDWVNEAHKFDIIYPRVWPWNVADDSYVFSFDIFSATIAYNLAITYDWLYPVLNQTQKDKIRGALLEKAILRVRKNYDYFWWSKAYKCNWSAICYAGLGLPSLALLKDNPELVDVVKESYNRLNLTFDQIGEDGGWQEGRSYYGYMMSESIFFMEALKRLTNGNYDLYKHEKIANDPLGFLLYSLTANFADSGGQPIGPTYLLNKLISETNSNVGAFYRDNYFGEGEGIFDIIWPRSKVNPVEPKLASKYFRTLDWAILRSNFNDPSNFTIACKAGFNDDPHHGHLDCGTFTLTWQNTSFIRDIGSMGYDEYYFNQDRWDYPFASSLGHNVVMVNDEKQIPAKEKNKPWKKNIGGKIIDFTTTSEQDYVLLDPTHAYPNKELKKWRRSIVLDKPAIAVVFDEVESAIGAKIVDRFFPGVGVESFSKNDKPKGSYELLGDFVYLSDGKGNNLALIPIVLDDNFEISKGKLPFVEVTKNAKLKYAPFFEISTHSDKDATIIATIILPVNSIKEAENVTKTVKMIKTNSFSIELSINPSAEKLSWSFVKDNDGYIINNTK